MTWLSWSCKSTSLVKLVMLVDQLNKPCCLAVQWFDVQQINSLWSFGANLWCGRSAWQIWLTSKLVNQHKSGLTWLGEHGNAGQQSCSFWTCWSTSLANRRSLVMLVDQLNNPCIPPCKWPWILNTNLNHLKSAPSKIWTWCSTDNQVWGDLMWLTNYSQLNKLDTFSPC